MAFSIELRAMDKTTGDIRKKLNTLRASVLEWVSSLQVGPCQFRMNEDCDDTIYTTCFALFIFDLFNELKAWPPRERDEWISYINSFQDAETGYFVPQGYAGELNTKAVHQLTAFCMSALHLLDAEPKHHLYFLGFWDTPDDIYEYLEKKGCTKGLPGSGNMAMFLGIFLTYRYEVYGDERGLDLLSHWFSCHNQTQNHKTGFWGGSLQHAYYKGFQNGLHQFVIYNYWSRPLAYNTKIVDTILSLQDGDGFFGPVPGGGGCWDFDAADTLINYGYKMRYKEKEIEASLSRLFDAILLNQNDDGGFCESKRVQTSLMNCLHPSSLHFIFSNGNYYTSYYKLRTMLAICLLRKQKLYTHWTRQGRFWHQSDLWNTWFRCLTVAEIDETINPYKDVRSADWKFHNMIGLGYFRHFDTNVDDAL